MGGMYLPVNQPKPCSKNSAAHPEVCELVQYHAFHTRRLDMMSFGDVPFRHFGDRGTIVLRTCVRKTRWRPLFCIRYFGCPGSVHSSARGFASHRRKDHAFGLELRLREFSRHPHGFLAIYVSCHFLPFGIRRAHATTHVGTPLAVQGS